MGSTPGSLRKPTAVEHSGVSGTTLVIPLTCCPSNKTSVDRNTMNGVILPLCMDRTPCSAHASFYRPSRTVIKAGRGLLRLHRISKLKLSFEILDAPREAAIESCGCESSCLRGRADICRHRFRSYVALVEYGRSEGGRWFGFYILRI